MTDRPATGAAPAPPADSAAEPGSDPGVQRVLDTLAVHDVHPQLATLPAPARTAAAAASALGVSAAEIASSLLFRAPGAHGTHSPLLVVTSGAHRVDLAKVADLTGLDRLEQADPAFVRAVTGFSVGAVAPVGHPSPVPVVVDVSLSRHLHVWAGAGHSRVLFRTTYEELLRVTAGHAMEVA